MQVALKQKEAELKQANAELEERGKLLYKTKVLLFAVNILPVIPTSVCCRYSGEPPALSQQPVDTNRGAASAGGHRAAAGRAHHQPQGGAGHSRGGQQGECTCSEAESADKKIAWAVLNCQLQGQYRV